MKSESVNGEVVHLQDVHLSFSGIKVLQGITFSIRSGESVAVIGPNGAGKTSLINVLTGFYRVDRGEVRVLGTDARRVRPEVIGDAGVTRTFQTPQIVNDMNVVGNVLVGLHRRSRASWWDEILMTRKARERELSAWERARSAIERVGLSDRAHVPGKELSLGERRMLEVARAFAGGPRLLLLDEPASGLSHHEADQLLGLLKELNAVDGLTMVVIEHSMSFVRRSVDRAIAIHRGQVLTDGPVESVLRDQSVIDAYLGSSERGSI